MLEGGEAIAFADTTVPQGASVAYVVRARNALTCADSAQTRTVSAGAPPNFRITSVKRTGTNGAGIEFKFNRETGQTDEKVASGIAISRS